MQLLGPLTNISAVGFYRARKSWVNEMQTDQSERGTNLCKVIVKEEYQSQL